MIENETKKAIETINLNKEIDYLVTIEKWDLESAKQAAKFYKNYLYLLLKHPNEILPPSYEIQIIWKIHILFSLDVYIEIKRKLFFKNQYLLNYKNYFDDHKFVNNIIKDDYSSNTRHLYFKEFGESLPEYGAVALKGKYKHLLTDALKISLYVLFLIMISILIVFFMLFIYRRHF